jgi:CheY-like chemotaxis protein
MSRRPRILVLDNDERWRSALVQILEDADFLVTAARNPAEVLESLEKGFYHLLVLDINMDSSDPQNIEGMSLLRDLHETGKSASLGIVMLSGFGTIEQMREAFRDYKVTDFIEKHRFDDEKFVDHLKRILAQEAKINLKLRDSWQGLRQEDAVVNLRVGEVRIKPSTPFHGRVATEFDDLLCRLFHDAESIVVEPMRRGHSGAGVLRVRPFYNEGGGARQVVVKFGDAADLAQEEDHFKRFARPFLGGGRSTNLEQFARTPLLGGICYSLLGAANHQFEDFASFYQKADIDAVRRVLDNLFLDTCAAWYANTGPLEPRDLSDEYRALLRFTAENLTLACSERLGKSVHCRKDLRFEALGTERKFINPILAIADRHLYFSTYCCITHGDLSGSNVLVDGRGSTWLIDFLRTGRSHILRDFAQLDATVRVLLLGEGEATLAERLELEETLMEAEGFAELGAFSDRFVTSNPALAKAFATAVHLRTLAARQVARNPEGDFRELQAALFYFSLNIIRFFNLPMVQREHALLSAALLAERLGLAKA